MDYSHKYFGKSLSSLTWKDIAAYFVEAKEETETIEFKSFVGTTIQEGHYKKIFEATCALLNSNGGIIIWGAPEGVKVAGKKEKSFQGDLKPLNTVLEKDALISKISSKITAMPEGISVQILQKGTDCICVFEIQKSNYSPHQTDNTYYMRLDGQSVPAPHYFIEAMFRQIKYPNLEGYLKFHPLKLSQNAAPFYYLAVDAFIFNLSALQNETNLHISLSNDLGFITGNGFTTDPNISYWNNGQSVKYRDVMSVLHYGSPLHKTITIEIPTNRIPGEINVDLFFGGKNSPQKVSEYRCAITIPPGINDPLQCNIIDKRENIFMHDLPQVSKAEMLKIMLDR